MTRVWNDDTEKLTCPRCWRFIGFRKWGTWPEPAASRKCCVREIKRLKRKRTPRRKPPRNPPSCGSNSDHMDEGHYQGYGSWDGAVRAYENRND
jgi:hypothetical protein